MSTTILQPDKAIKQSLIVLFMIALAGQLIFAVYISIRWGLPLVTGLFDTINKSTHVTGFVEGDTSGNGMLFIHAIGAAILSFSGLIQLVPSIRKKYPVFHRLNGRLFLTLGLLGALTGLYLTWLRGSRISDIASLGITLNGILIPIFIYYAWRFAISRNMAQHRRFAIHTFILVNGVWFFRLFLFGWIATNKLVLGNSVSFDGPAAIAFSFLCYLGPMALAELYFWSEKQKEPYKKWVTFGAFCFCGFIMVIGTLGMTCFQWLPTIQTSISLNFPQ